jgi:hypothetical protein
MKIHKIWKDGELIEVEGNIDAILNVKPELSRLKTYNLHHQLDCLYNDIQAGLFGDSAKSGSFCKYIESVKEAYPKT